MKYYALLHAVCGLAEGYSDTTVRWFNDLDKAMEAKRKTSWQSLMDDVTKMSLAPRTACKASLPWISRRAKHEIVKIIELKPVWPNNTAICEYLVWDQMNCEAPYDGDYLPTDMAVIKDLCERQEAVSDSFDVEAFHEFVSDLWYGQAMFDADDLCIYYFQCQRHLPSQPVEFK